MKEGKEEEEEEKEMAVVMTVVKMVRDGEGDVSVVRK